MNKNSFSLSMTISSSLQLTESQDKTFAATAQ